MTKKAKKAPFDAKVFLATTNGGRTLSKYRTNKVLFSQGESADSVFYIQKGQVKVTVISEQGRKPSLRSWVPTNSAERGA
jgi:CRP/FNR family transcriptional regulator, cyclic AMP receptor protein